MQLTPAQETTLRNYIQADPVLSQISLADNGAELIAEALNQFASPDYWVFKSKVPNEDIGNAMNGTEIAGMAGLNMQRYIEG
jgi:hypothetical protein